MRLRCALESDGKTSRWNVNLFLSLMLFSVLVQAQSRAVPGVIYPLEERALALSSSGLVAEVPVQEGQIVDSGQPLLKLDARLQELEAERFRLILKNSTELQVLSDKLEIMDRQFDLLEELYSLAGTVSRDEIDSLKLERIGIRGQIDKEKSRKMLEALEYRRSVEILHDMEILAPLAGVVTRIGRRPGEWVSAGEPIIHLVDMSEVLLKIYMPDAIVRQLEVGQVVPASIAGVGAREGVVAYVAPVADPASSLVEVHIRLNNADGMIRPGTQGQLLPVAPVVNAEDVVRPANQSENFPTKRDLMAGEGNGEE